MSNFFANSSPAPSSTTPSASPFISTNSNSTYPSPGLYYENYAPNINTYPSAARLDNNIYPAQNCTQSSPPYYPLNTNIYSATQSSPPCYPLNTDIYSAQNYSTQSSPPCYPLNTNIYSATQSSPPCIPLNTNIYPAQNCDTQSSPEPYYPLNTNIYPKLPTDEHCHLALVGDKIHPTEYLPSPTQKVIPEETEEARKNSRTYITMQKWFPRTSTKPLGKNFNSRPLGQFGQCKECKSSMSGYNWCQYCNSEYFQHDFVNWSSGIKELDNFIQVAQVKAVNARSVIEWIEYQEFTNVEHLADGGNSSVYVYHCNCELQLTINNSLLPLLKSLDLRHIGLRGLYERGIQLSMTGNEAGKRRIRM
jgi:hypothetical protein